MKKKTKEQIEKEKKEMLKFINEAFGKDKHMVLVVADKGLGMLANGLSPLEMATHLANVFEEEPRFMSACFIAESLMKNKKRMLDVFGRDGFKENLMKSVEDRNSRSYFG